MLITNPAQMRQHIGGMFEKDIVFDTVRPYVEQAQAQIIRPLLGADLLAELTQTDPLSEVLAEVRQAAERAISWVAYQEAQVGFLYQFGSAGFVKFMGADVEKLTLWELDTILADTARKADDAIEQLMAVLHQHKAQLPAWTNSDAFRQANALMIPTAQLLRESLPEVSATYTMLAKLQGFMPRTERRYIKGVLGQTLYADLKQKLWSNDSLSDAEAELWQRCRDLLGPATLWEALPSLAVQFYADGIRVISSFKGLKDQKAADRAQVQELRDTLWKQVESTRGELKAFLNATASASVFSSYFTSGLYVAPGPSRWELPDNEGKKHFRL